MGFVISFLLFLASSAAGPDSWVVRVGDDRGMLGTGFAVGTHRNDEALIVTAHHVTAKPVGYIRINGRPLSTSDVLVGTDAGRDVACYYLNSWDGQVGGLGRLPRRPGLPVRLQGNSTGLQRSTIQSVDANQLWVTCAVVPGDSGAPIVGEDGLVVGMVAVGREERYPNSVSYIPPSGGPSINAIQACLRRWGWQCRPDGRCEPITITPPQQYTPPSPITSQSLPPPAWTPIPRPESTPEGDPALMDILQEIAETQKANRERQSALDLRIQAIESGSSSPTIINVDFKPLDVTALPPIRFSIRGPGGVESRDVRLGEEVKLYLEGSK